MTTPYKPYGLRIFISENTSSIQLYNIYQSLNSDHNDTY